MGYLEYRFSSMVLDCDACICVTIPSLYNPWELYQHAGKDKGNNALALEAEYKKDLDKLYPKNHKFPTVYLMHGGSQNCTAWVHDTRVGIYAQERGVMTVSVDLFKSFGCDMKHGYKYFTYLTEEVMRLVQHAFPSSPRREDNFIAGFSMGAHVAMKTALRCPEKFAAVLSMSGAKDIVKMIKRATDILGTDGMHEFCDFGPVDAIYGSENDLLYLAKSLAESDRPRPKIFNSCGEDDYALDLCREFNQYLDSVGLENTLITVPGVHDSNYTDMMIHKALFELFPIREGK